MRIKSREYAFDGPCPFESEDICDFFPIVNHVMPKCKAPQVLHGFQRTPHEKAPARTFATPWGLKVGTQAVSDKSRCE